MLVLAVPVVAFSGHVRDDPRLRVPDAAWVTAVPPVLGTVMYLWGGSPFLTGAVGGTRARRPG